MHAIECMSSWVGSSLSRCHRGVCPHVGVVSGYGRRFHPVVGVRGVVGLGLVVVVLVDGVCAGESGVGRSERVDVPAKAGSYFKAGKELAARVDTITKKPDEGH